jgi:hypothetical protein
MCTVESVRFLVRHSSRFAASVFRNNAMQTYQNINRSVSCASSSLDYYALLLGAEESQQPERAPFTYTYTHASVIHASKPAISKIPVSKRRPRKLRRALPVFAAPETRDGNLRCGVTVDRIFSGRQSIFLTGVVFVAARYDPARLRRHVEGPGGDRSRTGDRPSALARPHQSRSRHLREGGEPGGRQVVGRAAGGVSASSQAKRHVPGRQGVAQPAPAGEERLAATPQA